MNIICEKYFDRGIAKLFINPDNPDNQCFVLYHDSCIKANIPYADLSKAGVPEMVLDFYCDSIDEKLSFELRIKELGFVEQLDCEVGL